MNRLIAAWVILCSIPGTAHAQRWTTHEAMRIKGPQSETRFGDIRGMAMSTSGHFYILDAKKAALYRFNSTGEMIWEAAIPLTRGEKGNVDLSVIALSDGSPIVVDVIGTHTIKYDTAGALLSDESFYPLLDVPVQWSTLGSNVVAVTRPLPSASGGSEKDIRHSVRTMPASHTMGREITSSQIPSRTLFDRETMTMGVNTSPAAIIMESTGTRLFVANNQRYSISVYDTTGAKVSTLSRRIPRKPIGAADRIRATREIAHILDAVPPDERGTIKWKAIYSDSLPAIAQIAAGDSIVLVRNGGAASQETLERAQASVRWDVLGLDNAFQGYVDLPSGYRASAIRDGKVYGVMSRANEFAVVVLTLIPPDKPVK